MANWIIHDGITALNFIINDVLPIFPDEPTWQAFEATPENIEAYRYLERMDLYFPLPPPEVPI